METMAYKQYVKQILKYPLMSFEEEVEHSKLIQKGDNTFPHYSAITLEIRQIL